jgi:hypothetical protein
MHRCPMIVEVLLIVGNPVALGSILLQSFPLNFNLMLEAIKTAG